MRGRSIAVRGLCALACLTSASAASAAPDPQERQGFWIGLGAGVGSAHATCDDCDGEGRETGFAGNMRLGGTLNERLLLGAEVNGWSKEEEGVTLDLYNFTGTLTFYPQASSGFFVKGGVGLAFLDTQFREGSTTVTVDLGTGLSLLAGAGYDIRVGRKISITPAVSFWYGWAAGAHGLGGPIFTLWKHNVVAFTVGVTFH